MRGFSHLSRVSILSRCIYNSRILSTYSLVAQLDTSYPEHVLNLKDLVCYDVVFDASSPTSFITDNHTLIKYVRGDCRRGVAALIIFPDENHGSFNQKNIWHSYFSKHGRTITTFFGLEVAL